ncbi:uncharacterized protein [Eleutherodactylus coqui]|uniref:uncharacterized protein n=1 Tax=Eleutherodactylus coqui TaxID=57060 RepID=UPI0034618F0A
MFSPPQFPQEEGHVLRPDKPIELACRDEGQAPLQESEFTFRKDVPVPQYYRYLLTFRFAIEEINRDQTILPNISLGYHVYDSCSDSKKSVRSVLQILSGPGRTVPNYCCKEQRNVAGFIGDLGSESTVSMAQILAIYRYSQISYGATSSVLNDRHRYPTFYRTSQSAQISCLVLSKIMKFFRWTWVGIVCSDDDSGNEEIQILTQYLTMNEICVAYTIKVKYVSLNAIHEIERKNMEIISKSSAQVIILCGMYSSYLADWLHALRIVLRDKTLVFGPPFALMAAIIEHHKEALNGSLAIQPFRLPLPDMSSFYESFQTVNHPEDMLLAHIWLVNVHCLSRDSRMNELLQFAYKKSLHNCTGTERVTDFYNFQDPGLSDRVYKAVYILAQALHDLRLTRNCQSAEINYLHKYSHLKSFRGRRSLATESDGCIESVLPHYGTDYRHLSAANMSKIGRHSKERGGEHSLTPRLARGQSDLQKYLKEKTTRSPHATSKMGPAAAAALCTAREDDSDSEGEEEGPLSRSFMKSLLTKTMSPVLAELAEIKEEVRHMGRRVEELEGASAIVTSHALSMADILKEQHLQINKMLLMQEDLENRNRRNNLRIKGLPESWAPDVLKKVLLEIFADLVGSEKAGAINIERAHRALRPQPAAAEPPRDIVCKLLAFSDTAAILEAARNRKNLQYESSPIQIFQDLAPATLAKRRLLKPLLDELRAKNIKYAWLYPFGLGINYKGKRINIRSPEDLRECWPHLGLDPIELPNWLPLPDLPSLPHLPTPENWRTLHRYLGSQKDNTGNLLFYDNGDFISQYSIVNWLSSQNGSKLIKYIGSTTTKQNAAFNIKADQILWKNRVSKIPASQCSENCLPGTRKVSHSKIHTCCYNCVQCSSGEISNITDSETCMKCTDLDWPNMKKDRCVPKQLEFLSYTDDTMVLVISLVSTIFSFLTFMILVAFILHQDTAIVKANNRNLSFLLLVSIMLSFLCVFSFLGHPVDLTCILRQVSFGILFTIAVSCVLAKTIMVSIAFRATKPDSFWKHWIGSKWTNFLVVFCTSIQVIICMGWLALAPPFLELDTHSYQRKIIVQCNEGCVIGFYSVLGYLGVLAAVSFIMAFLARTLPDSFNEAKYITFSMLVFCSVWIAMIPAYLSTRGKYMVAVEIFAILTSCAGLLGCIFFPKCYIILWRQDLNTRTRLLEGRSR